MSALTHSTHYTPAPWRHALLVVGLGIAAPAVITGFASTSVYAASQQQQHNFFIAAGDLETALSQFSRQSGVTVSFLPDIVSGKITAGVQQPLTAEQALDLLLQHSGLQAVKHDDGSFSITAMAATAVMELPVVKVNALYGSKQTNTLQESSASVAVVTAQDIENSQLRSFRDAFRYMGNVMDGDWINSGFVIRGVNSEGFASGSAPLGSLYIDGVLQSQDGARRGARGLWDVEQVEVYRGPQSTLTGRAAMAGSIYIKTKDPVFDDETAFSTTLGSDQLRGYAVLVNRPLTDELAVRLAAEYERSESDLHYPSYERFDHFDEWETDLFYNVRGKLLYEPVAHPETRALLSYSFSHDSPNDRDIGGPGIGWNWKDDRGDFNLPVYTEPRETEVHNLGLEVTHDFSDALRLTSQTGMTRTYTDRSSINKGTPGEINVLDGDRRDWMVSQEFRLNFDQDKWQWVAGVWSSYETYDNQWDRTTGSAVNNRSRTQQDLVNLALFGEASYEFVPSWKITLGARADYTRQKLEDFYDQAPLGGSLRTTLRDYDATNSELRLLPKIGLSKDFGDNQTLGFVYSEGFRSGGTGYDSVLGQPYDYDPEKAKNYEVFYKGQFLDQRLSLNANVFYTDFNDQQVELIDFSTFNIVTQNAASSRSYGIEVEPRFQFSQAFSAFLSVSYLNTEFEQGSTHYLVDLAGYPFPEAPEWTLATGAHYQFNNGVYIGADMKYTDSHMARLGTSPPNDFVDSRTIVNLQTGIKLAQWEVNVYAENLFDKRYFTYLDDDSYATLGEARTVGVNVQLKF